MTAIWHKQKRGFTQRPEGLLRLNRNSSLFRGLVFAGLGGVTKTNLYHDSSLYGNHGTLVGMDPATDWVFDPTLGRFVNEFDKSDDCIVLPACTLVAPITFACWAKATVNISDNQVFFGYGPADTGSAGPTYLQVYSGVWRWIVNNLLVRESAATLNSWTHLAGTYDRTAAVRQRFYVNGVLRSSYAASDIELNAGEFVIGRRPGSNLLYFGGQTADHLVYNRAISPAEIQQLADPSNTLLSGLILPPRRLLYPVSISQEEPTTGSAVFGSLIISAA